MSQIQNDNGVELCQFTCPASPGNSGGPLFNDTGEVVGIVSRQYSEGRNVNFAIPSTYALGLDVTLPTQPWGTPQSNMHKPAFQTAWEHIKADESRGFEELQRLKASNFQDDPIKWKLTATCSGAKLPRRSDGQSGQSGGTMLQLKSGKRDPHA